MTQNVKMKWLTESEALKSNKPGRLNASRLASMSVFWGWKNALTSWRLLMTSFMEVV